MVRRNFARLRLSVLVYLIDGEAGEEVIAAAAAEMPFDRVIIPI